MNEDYKDHTKWIEVRGDVSYFQDYDDYSLEEVTSMCTTLLNQAKNQGLVGCFLRFSSHIDARNGC